MLIKNIKIENFKSISNLDFDFEDTTVALIGKNGRGKTAFKEAFYAGITGEFPENCIQNGKDFCSVEITLNDDTTFKRIQNREKANKVTLNGKTTTAKTLNEIITTITKLSKDVLKIVMSTDVLQSLQPAEFGKFVTEYIPEKLDFATVDSYMSNVSKESKQILAEVLPPMPDTFGIKQLNDGYNALVDTRKTLKREYATYEAKINSFKNTVETERDISEVENELNEILRKEGAQKSLKVALNLYNTAVVNRTNAEKNLKILEEKIKANTSLQPDIAVLENIKTERQALQKAIIDAKTLSNTIGENIRMFANTINNLNKPVCPISEKLICTTDKTHIKSELEALIASNREGLEIQKQAIETNSKKLLELDAAETKYRANESAYKEKVLLIQQYKHQKENLPTVPEKPEETTIIDYSTEIIRLRKERDAIIALNQHKKDIEESKKIATKIYYYNELCDALNAKGEVMSKINSYYMSIFDSICNTTATNLKPGLEFKFFADNGIVYHIKTDSGKQFQSFESLSSGEQLFALLVLMDMFSQLTGSRMLILDDLDKLDKTAFKDLLELVTSENIKNGYDHIILGAVDHDDIAKTINDYGIKKIY